MTQATPFPRITRGQTHDVLPNVKQQLLALGLEVGDPNSAEFDQPFEYALRRFQQDRGLVCDGMLGEETFIALDQSRYQLGDRVLRFDPVRPLIGDDVAQLQKLLGSMGLYDAKVDGTFETSTDAAVREAQRSLGLIPDGIAGPRTLAGFTSVYRNHRSGNLYAMRERARMTSSGPSLSGRTFIIEAATTTSDFSAVPITAQQQELERTYAGDIARRLEGRLSALGAATVVFIGDAADSQTVARLDPSVVITITLDVNPSRAANGMASFYYGHVDDDQLNSPVGQRLAQFIQKEVVARTGLQDCGAHPRTWLSLRRISSPKIHVVPGYLTNSHDRELLADEQVRDTIAHATLVSLQRLYTADDAHPSTGAMDIVHEDSAGD